MASEPGLARVCLLWAILSLVLLVTPGHTTAYRSLALPFVAAIHFAVKRYAPFVLPSYAIPPLVLGLAAVVHWSALTPKALRSSRRHHIHSFSWSPTKPASSTNSPSITHFRSLVSSMRTTNPANKICLLRKVALMLSLPVLISVSR